jgi:hypothetical protein
VAGAVDGRAVLVQGGAGAVGQGAVGLARGVRPGLLHPLPPARRRPR